MTNDAGGVAKRLLFCAVAALAACGPEKGPSVLWSKDPLSQDNPYPDPRLLSAGGLGARPRFYESFVPADAVTGMSRGLFESWARELNTLPGFGNFNPVAVRFSEPPEPGSLEACAVFAVRTSGSSEWAAVPAQAQYAADPLLSDAQKFMLVQPSQPLPPGADAILAIRRGPKTTAGKAFIRSVDYQEATSSARTADEEAAASVLLGGTRFAKSGAELIFTMRFQVARATAELETVVAWANSVTVTPRIPAKALSPPQGAFVSTDADFTTLDAWLLNTPWPSPTRGNVGRVILGTFDTRDLRDAKGVWKPEWVADPSSAPVSSLGFVVTVPTGPKPAGGWPVVVVSHGASQRNTPADGARSFSLFQAQLYAERGFATLGIDAVNHGNRGVWTDSLKLRTPRVLRDSFRQTAVDTVLATRLLQTLDVDGDGSADLTGDLEFFGYSMGGGVGAEVLAVDPAIKTGVLQSMGGGSGAALVVDGTNLDLLLTTEAGLPLDSALEKSTYPLVSLTGQLVGDAVDPENFVWQLKSKHVLVSEGVGDKTQPNSGTELFATALGLTPATENQSSPTGVSAWVKTDAARFGVTATDFDPHNVFQQVAPLRATVQTYLESRGTQLIVPVP